MKKQIEYPERHFSGIGVAVFRSVEVLLVKRKKLHITQATPRE